MDGRTSDTAATTTAYVKIHDNQIVAHGNFGIGLAWGFGLGLKGGGGGSGGGGGRHAASAAAGAGIRVGRLDPNMGATGKPL